jgi:hypothetical protein
MCHLAEISRQDNNIFCCNGCKLANACVLIGNLKGCICSLDKPINMIVKSEWIETIVGINEEALLKLLHENRIHFIHKLSNINIHGSFSLSPIGDFIGYPKLQHDKNSLVCKELVKKLDLQYYKISHCSFSNFTNLQFI